MRELLGHWLGLAKAEADSLSGMTDRKARAKTAEIQAAGGIVPRCSFRPVAVRCDKAHLAYKLRKCKLLKLSHFQHSSPELSRSPEIVLRGTILSGAEAVRREADSLRE